MPKRDLPRKQSQFIFSTVGRRGFASDNCLYASASNNCLVVLEQKDKGETAKVNLAIQFLGLETIWTRGKQLEDSWPQATLMAIREKKNNVDILSEEQEDTACY